MKNSKASWIPWAILGPIFLLTFFCGLPSGSAAAAPKGATFNEAFPGLASGALLYAKPSDLSNETLLSGAEITIKRSDMEAILKKIDPAMRKQMEKNLFFILEQHFTEEFLVREAKKAIPDKSLSDEERIRSFLSAKFSGENVSDDEAKQFYEKNKETVAGIPFEQVKENIKEYLLQDKAQKAVSDYISTIGKKAEIRVNREWAEKQAALSKDNPVDRARGSGKPTLVEFGATGCVPCDMMQPVLDNLRKNYGEKLNVVFVHVVEEQMLGARFGIRSIPVQVFFDAAGKEFSRHTGFYPEKEVETVLKNMGVNR